METKFTYSRNSNSFDCKNRNKLRNGGKFEHSYKALGKKQLFNA